MLKQKKQKSLSEETKKTIVFSIICALSLICAIVGFISGVSLATGDIIATIFITFQLTIFGALIIPLIFLIFYSVLALIELILSGIF